MKKYHFYLSTLKLIFILFFSLPFVGIGQTCDNYSNPALWTTPGNTNINNNCAPTASGALSITGNRVLFNNFKPRQTRRLRKNIGTLIANQNQFRFEFDFILNNGGNDPAAILLAITQNNQHPYAATSGSSVETTNNTIEVRLGNPLNTNAGYFIRGTSKFGNVRGGFSNNINININTNYNIRVQRMNATTVELSVWTGNFTNLVGVTCFAIDPNISSLRRLQHSGINSAGCSRFINAEIDNTCYHSTLIGTVCTNCGPQVNISNHYNCATATSTLTANTSGGTPPYTYSWSTSATTSTINPTLSGIYTVTITDAAGCTASASINFSPAAGINATFSVQNTDCSGSCSGSITVTSVSGGTPGYTYTVNGNPMAGPTFNGLCPGLNIIVIDDASGCRAQFELIVGVDPGCWQQTTWNNALIDHGNDIEVDMMGNVYVVGDFLSNTDFQCSGNIQGRNTANGQAGMYLAKLDPCGDILWVAWSESSVPGEWANARAIELDENSQQLYVTGEYDGSGITLKGGDLSSSQTPMNGYSNSMYVSQFDMNTGQVNWMLDYLDPTTATLHPRGICHDGTNAFIGGHISSFGSWYSFLMKVSITGTPSVNYITFLPDKDAFVEDVEMQSTGDLVAVGRYIGQIGTGMSGTNYPIISGNTGSLFDGFVQGISDVGGTAVQNWIYTSMATSGNAGLYDVAIDDYDNIYVTGHVIGATSNSFKHTGTSVSLPAGFNRQAIVARLRPTGNWGTGSWMNYSDPINNLHEEGKGIDVHGTAVVINGNTLSTGSMQFLMAGSNTANGLVAPANTSNSVYAAHMGTTGNVLGLNITEGTGIQNAEAISSNTFFGFSTGDYSNTLTVNGTNYDGASPWTTKAFTLRSLKTAPGLPFTEPNDDEPLSTNELLSGHELVLYPNPTNGILRIKSKSTTTIEVMDVSGKRLELKTIGAKEEETLDVSHLHSGVYLIRDVVSGKSVRFVKN